MQNIKDLIIKGMGYALQQLFLNGGPYANFKAITNNSEEILNILIILTFLQYKIHKTFSICRNKIKSLKPCSTEIYLKTIKK